MYANIVPTQAPPLPTTDRQKTKSAPKGADMSPKRNLSLILKYTDCQDVSLSYFAFRAVLRRGWVLSSIIPLLAYLPRLKSAKKRQKGLCSEASSEILNPSDGSLYLHPRCPAPRTEINPSDRPHPKTQINAF